MIQQYVTSDFPVNHIRFSGNDLIHFDSIFEIFAFSPCKTTGNESENRMTSTNL